MQPTSPTPKALTPCPTCRGQHLPSERCGQVDTHPGSLPAHASERDPLLGVTVGNFKMRRLLGRGGMGAVYLAEHPVIGSQVAIKVLHPALAQNPALVRRFYAEAKAANVVAHENIVRVLDLGHSAEAGFYLVMEYVEAPTLNTLLTGKPADLAWSDDVLGQLCTSLGEAHARGVVHRDLKPDNVLVLERAGRPFVKITDFGIAKLREDLAVSNTIEGQVLGTPEFMSPEQCEGRPTDSRTDVYALGVMAYQLATGRLPFTGGTAQLFAGHLNHTPRPPIEHRPDLPESWNEAILRALAKNRDDRFPDTNSLLAALRARPRTPTPLPTKPGQAVEVSFGPGAPAIPLLATDVTRSGALIHFQGEPPALFARVRVSLGAGAERRDLDAEVVRHVTADEARTWGMSAGFAVQFRGARADSGILKLSVPPPRPVPRPEVSGLSAEQRERLAWRAEHLTSNHYEVLDLALDAGQAQILEQGTRAVGELRALESLPLSAADAALVRTLLTRSASAIAVLATARSRLQHDASIGNFRGVARALSDGAPPEMVVQEHSHFRTERPEVAQLVERKRVRARMMASAGDGHGALQEVEAALEIDPLDLGLHQLIAQLRPR
jgi:tRNA A-37 threonylcarbamoyl transferase component Bud32